MDLVLVGANHRTSTADVRASLAFDDEGIQRTLARVQADGVLRESAILATYNRTEFYGVADGADEGLEYLRRVIADYAHVDLWRATLRSRPPTPRCTCRVAGLDSMMLRTPSSARSGMRTSPRARPRRSVDSRSALGQRRACGRRARRSRHATGAVRRLGRRLLAERVFGSPAGREVLVVGAGDAGRLAAPAERISW